MASAADVPHKYDLFISDGTNSQGFVLLDAFKSDANVPEKAIHSFSPTFVPRTNVEGNYGDDSQAFFLTFSQNDWSLGEQQKYQQREGATRRYWIGTNIDVRIPGQVSLRRDVRSVDTGVSNVVAAAGRSTNVRLATETNLYSIDGEGTVTDHGAHGLGAAPGTPHGLACDNLDTYLTSTDGLSVGVRKWDGSAFSTFSANGAESLVYLNNALYGLAAGVLYRWTSAGVRSALFTWQDADGAAQTFGEQDGQLLPFGGKFLIHLTTVGGLVGSTWIYDGVGVSKLFNHPPNFVSRSICEFNGTVFFGGFFSRLTGASTQIRPAMMYYSNGSVGLLWQADSYITFASDLGGSSAAALDNGILFKDDTTEKFMWYDAAAGGVHSVGSYATTGTGANSKMVACNNFAVLVESDDIVYQFPHNASVASSGTATSSLMDFDSSLDKLFRGIKIEFVSGGGTSTVDIAYRIGDVDGAYTTLQANAVSGTEYVLGTVGSAIEGRSISVRVTLNKGDSAAGPVLTRVYVRAAPIVNIFHRSKATLNLSGKAGDDHVMLRDESLEPLDGLALAHKLKELAQVEGLLNITDKFGTRVSIIESLEMVEVRPEEFVANVVFREV